jgi:hypothetical protein
MINMRLVALTWIIEPIIAVPIARMQTTERITLGPIARTQIIERITLVLIEPRRLIERIVPLRPIQPHLRTQLPTMQSRNMRLTRVPVRSRLTNNPWGETNLLS